MVDDPSVDDRGGFEFASGMDVFSEPGVMKANQNMQSVTFGTGAELEGLPTAMVDTTDAVSNLAYVAAGLKILETTNGSAFDLFLTNSQGVNLGLWSSQDLVDTLSSRLMSRFELLRTDTACPDPSESWSRADVDDAPPSRRRRARARVESSVPPTSRRSCVRRDP
jgi:hypothetical protein